MEHSQSSAGDRQLIISRYVRPAISQGKQENPNDVIGKRNLCSSCYESDQF